MKTVLERFLEYVSYPTQSDEESSSYPSTPGQLTLGAKLAADCTEIGLRGAAIDKNGYVTAILPAAAPGPTIGFLAHMDTSPDASGENIHPQIIKNYDGGDIPLQNGQASLSPEEFPALLQYKGDTIITSDGATLLGADDKAGVAEILTAMEYLINHPEIPHGEIKIAFTPDEEVGHGVDYFNVKSFHADFAYTVDGGEIGELEYENFNAARAIVDITGKSVHPGSAKNILVNASLLGTELISCLPANERPETTDGYDGFYHLTGFRGSVEKAKLTFIIRDFNKEHFEERKEFMKHLIDKFNSRYDNRFSLTLRDEYYNMSSIINKDKTPVDLAAQAMEACGVKPKITPIRGGTDGARLSFMGLPCPNLFAGGHNFHGPYEFIPLSSMEKAVETIVKIAQLSTQKD